MTDENTAGSSDGAVETWAVGIRSATIIRSTGDDREYEQSDDRVNWYPCTGFGRTHVTMTYLRIK